MKAKLGGLPLCLMLLTSLFDFSSPLRGMDTGIKEFARRHYIDSMPYEEVLRYGRTAVPTLLEMLHDPREADCYGNIVLYLGILGDEQVADPLINFLERDVHGEATNGVIHGLLLVPASLGHLAGNGSRKALEYLKSIAEPDVWRTKKLPWTWQGQPGEKRLGTALTSGAINGLGISAQPGALQWLHELQRRPGTPKSIKSEATAAWRLGRRINAEGRMKVLGSDPMSEEARGRQLLSYLWKFGLPGLIICGLVLLWFRHSFQRMRSHSPPGSRL